MRAVGRVARGERLCPACDERGFTLVEMLIVLVILGVLSALTVLAVRNVNESSRSAACSADVKTVESAIEAYVATYRKYPESISALASGSSPLIKSDPTLPGQNLTGFTYLSASGTLVGTC